MIENAPTSGRPLSADPTEHFHSTFVSTPPPIFQLPTSINADNPTVFHQPHPSDHLPPLSSLLVTPETDQHPNPDPAPVPLTLHQELEIQAVQAELAPHTRDIRTPHFLACDFRHSGWVGNREKIFAAFQRTDQPQNRLSNFEYCGSHSYVLQSVADPTIYRIAGSACHDRFCLPCAKERAFSTAQNVLDHLRQRRARFLTLTIRSTQEPLTELLDKLYSSFQRLRNSKLWKSCVIGGVCFLETNWYEREQRWHPHLHILIEGKYLPQPQLKRLWYAITGDSFIVDIRLVEDKKGAARYVTKYASKPFNNTFVTRPDQLDEAILALKGRKLLLTFGTWRGVTLLHKPDPGEWNNVGTLERYIQRAATGDPHCQAVLRSLTDTNLDLLYARAPPLPPTAPDAQQPPNQLTFFGHWKADGTWQYPF